MKIKKEYNMLRNREEFMSEYVKNYAMTTMGRLLSEAI